jgi:cobalt-zinc-cadmium efflux system outer membrane protein
MHTNKTFLPLAVLFAMTLGCSAPSSSGIHKAYHVGLLEERSDLTSSTVVTVHAASGTELDGVPLTLPNLLQWTMDNHPRLAQAGFAIEAAKGRALQAGLYPNPKLELRADEVADRTGPEGIITAPDVSQEIVTGGKL